MNDMNVVFENFKTLKEIINYFNDNNIKIQVNIKDDYTYSGKLTDINLNIGDYPVLNFDVERN